MLCASPISVRTGGAHQRLLVPCGQCVACRVNRRRIWAHRIMLERKLHGDACFVTLSYDDDHLPLTADGLPDLVPKHTQDWLKRLRKAIAPLRIRYYLAGEYGDETERSHYHVALFGYPSCAWGQSRYSRSRRSCCAACDLVRDTWGQGSIFIGSLEDDSANYIAGYVMKKMTGVGDVRLRGRHPEFSRMSLRPGIGADFMHDVASVVLDLDLVDREGDVPSALRHGSRILPLGRYLKAHLRNLATGDKDTPAHVKESLEEEMRVLRSTGKPVKEAYMEEKAVKLQQLDARLKLKPRRKLL